MSLILESSVKMPKKPGSKNYFTQDTEDAIVLYNNTADPELRSKIYEERIHYAFFKLTQNIIHTFKFYHTEVENLEHLQHEIIVFLLSKIHLFNPLNGAKAYSYFGTIVKRWCILYNEKNYKSKISKVSVDELSKDDSTTLTQWNLIIQMIDYLILWMNMLNLLVLIYMKSSLKNMTRKLRMRF
jgi:hypothetical protein